MNDDEDFDLEDFDLVIDSDIEDVSIELNTKNENDIKYIDITTKNGVKEIHLKSQAYAIQEAYKLGRSRKLFQNHFNKIFNNLSPSDQNLALKLMKAQKFSKK